jgi:hypothetical protein
MSKYSMLALISFSMLASCGAPSDNAENTPLAGKWRDEGKLMSVKRGGMAVDSAAFPGIEGIKEKMETKEFCGEPYFRNKEEFQAELDRSNPAECVLETVTVNGDRASAKGVCKAVKNNGVESRMALRGEAAIGADTIVYDMSFHLTATDQESGMGDTATVEARRTMTRIGDC